MKETLVRIEDVWVTYGTKNVIAGLSAEVRDIVRPGCVTGQIVGILGPSGSGKTQLSRVLTGLQAPSKGRVLVGSEGEPVQAGLVGYVAQNYPLLRHRTVLGNLTVAAMRAGATSKEAYEKAMEFLGRFNLSDKWEAYPAELSGGQRQRVAIAQQLLCSEHYLILDEPTTGLDPIMKDKVVEFIRGVSCLSEENTIFVISHDIGAVLSVADHLWLLGRAKDEKDAVVGSRIVYTYDLIERGLAWEPNPTELPVFAELQREIRGKFEFL